MHPAKETGRILAPLFFALALAGMADPAAAQFQPPAAFTRITVGAGPTRHQGPGPAPARSGFGAFAIEALGGAAGSAAGFGIGVLLADPDACDSEDIQCILEDVAVALGTSAAGATFGTWGAGRLASSQPSLAGAALGSLAGAVAGLGTLHLLEEELDLNVGDGVQFASYLLTHGVVTALGSRLVAAIRN